MKSYGMLQMNGESYDLIRHEDYMKYLDWLEEQEDLEDLLEAKRDTSPKLSYAEAIAGGGNRIAEIRKRAGMNQSDLAKKMGVTQSQISQWETGYVIPRQENIFEIADALGCEVVDVFPSVK